MKILNKVKWNYIENTLRIIEVVAIVIAALVVIQLPSQLKELKDNKEARSLEILTRLEDKLNQEKNYKLSLAIEKKQPIFRVNNGPFTEDDVDQYLNDLSSISDAYDRDLITIQSINDWFYYSFICTFENQEIKSYLETIRKEDSEYFKGIDSVYKDLINYNKM